MYSKKGIPYEIHIGDEVDSILTDTLDILETTKTSKADLPIDFGKF